MQVGIQEWLPTGLDASMVASEAVNGAARLDANEATRLAASGAASEMANLTATEAANGPQDSRPDASAKGE